MAEDITEQPQQLEDAGDKKRTFVVLVL